MTPASTADAVARIRGVWVAADIGGFLHAREVDGDLSVGADEPVVLASIFKLAGALLREIGVKDDLAVGAAGVG